MVFLHCASVSSTRHGAESYRINSSDSAQFPTASAFVSLRSRSAALPHPAQLVPQMPSVLTYTPHAPIRIANDTALAATAVSGDGTAATPYILEGWYINSTRQDAIAITRTTRHFIIRDCWVEAHGWSYLYDYYYGIHIWNITTATVTVENNFCQASYAGIYLTDVPFSVIINNTCYNNIKGLGLDRSPNSVVANNVNIQNYVTGITVGDSGNVTVINNTCDYNGEEGIYFYQTEAPMIVNNNCSFNDDGIFLSNTSGGMMVGNVYYKNYYNGVKTILCEALTVVNNTCHNNENGFYLSSSDLLTIENNICSSNEENGIILRSSQYATVAQNHLSHNNQTGIFLLRVPNSSVQHNRCSHNNHTGITIQETANSTIHHNSCYNNSYGLFVQDSDHCWVDENLFLENRYEGGIIDTSSANNQFHHNTFLANSIGTPQARDDGLNNLWHEESTREGNYWSDYAGTGFYPLAGLANATDFYPLVDILDFDEDGMPNLWEYRMGLNVTWNDAARDLDQDGMPNLWEYQMGLNATNPRDASQDPDKDGLTNLQEYQLGTDPHDQDSDNDFFPDGLDRGWWGNPRTLWDNPLTRGLLILLIVLSIWGGVIAFYLLQLRSELQHKHAQLQYQLQQLQEKLRLLSEQAHLNEVEDLVTQVHQIYSISQQGYHELNHKIQRKWLPLFLRPSITSQKTVFISVEETYQAFQEQYEGRIEELMDN